MIEPRYYIDGNFVPESQAKVSILDRGLLYGDGVFEGIKIYDGYAFRLTAHLERLYASARAIGLTVPLNMMALQQAVLETVRVNGYRDAYVRPIVTRGVGDLGINPRSSGKPSLFIIAKQWRRLYDDEIYRRGLKAIVARTRVVPNASRPAHIKSLNYLTNILAKAEANVAGVDEAIMLDSFGYVAEATADNILVVRDKTIYSPPGDSSLPGITKQTVFALAQHIGVPIKELYFRPAQLYQADECLLTGTVAEIVPVTQVDGHIIGGGEPGPITKLLYGRFKQIVGTPTWGTPVYAGESEGAGSKPVHQAKYPGSPLL